MSPRLAVALAFGMVLLLSIPVWLAALRLGPGKWLRRRPTLLDLLSVVIALAASGFILILPLRSRPTEARASGPGSVVSERPTSILEDEGPWILQLFALPPAAAATPVLGDALLHLAGQSKRAIGALRVLRLAAALFLAAVMFYGSPALVGFLYLPSLASTALADYGDPTAPGPRREGAGQPSHHE